MSTIKIRSLVNPDNVMDRGSRVKIAAAVIPSWCKRLKPEYVLHAVKPGPTRGQPLRGANRAARKSVAAMSAVNEFQPLAHAAEDDGMLTDDVAGPDR